MNENEKNRENHFEREEKEYRQESWKDLGDQIVDLIQDSIDAMDFSGLSNNIRRTVDSAREEASRQLKEAKRWQESRMRGVRRDGSEARSRDLHMEGRKGAYDSGRNARNAARSRERNRKQMAPVPSGRLKKLPGSVSGPVQTFLGAAGLMIFGALSLGFGLAGLGLSAIGSLYSATSVVLESIFLPLTAVSGVFLVIGVRQNRRARRIRQYSSLWEGRSYIDFKELETQSRLPMKRIRKDVDYVLEHQLLPEARIDEEETCLILTEEAGRQYDAAKQAQREREEEARRKAQREADMAAAAEQNNVLLQGEKFLSELKEQKQTIFSPVMQPKLDELELILSRIVVCIREHPEKSRQMDRLTDYYLPSVMKLLRVYQELEKQPIQGENIQKTKKEIEDSLDMINQALKTMFDDMFQDVAMDISSDIRVLEMMLAKDGWTEQTFSPSGRKEI